MDDNCANEVEPSRILNVFRPNFDGEFSDCPNDSYKQEIPEQYVERSFFLEFVSFDSYDLLATISD